MVTTCIYFGRLMAIVTLLFAKIQYSTLSEVRGRLWPAHYTDAHRDLHQLVEEKTHPHLEDFQIIIPFRTNYDFQFASHVVRHKRRNRVRRSSPDETDLSYSLTGFGQEFRVRLKPNHQLLTPSFSISKMKNGIEEKSGYDKGTNCHYRGKLISHEEGSAVLSTCDGLTGLLKTSKDEILIEPVLSSVNHSFRHSFHPHIVYKRRHLEKAKRGLHFCGKKTKHPVSIPLSSEDHVMRILSDGEIELDRASDRKVARSRRSLVSVESRREDKESELIVTTRPSRKTVETLVVVDRELIRNHDRDSRDVTTYVLTIMNMVSDLFQDHTLDEKVNIAVMGLILLQDSSGLHLDHKADRSLARFCDWQFKLNHSKRGVPDHTILLTGLDICIRNNGPCETLGLAQIGGMCSRRHSCTINEDLGLGLAFTVAHETGHRWDEWCVNSIFGMKHDGQGNSCGESESYVMSPTLNGRNGVLTWSQCSREKMNRFLLSPASSCLDTFSSIAGNSLHAPLNLPGEVYSATTQCRWQFGPSASLCHFRYNHNKTSICTILWCQREGRRACSTKFMPAAEGTNCGENMYCRRGSCTPHGSDGPQAIDGSWAAYGPWSTCTRSCGGGVQFRQRICSNPAPQFGGRYCAGESKAHQLCNIEKCSNAEVDFRSIQCAAFNSKPYRRNFFNWVPFTKYKNFGRNSCDLLCKAEGFGFFDMLADKVVDGTRCDENSLDVCIDGVCRHVGCDDILDSNSTHDVCGVCNGDNSTCDVITGEFNGPVGDSGYYKVVQLPKGARNVRIEEKSCCTRSYIAIKSASNKYYLNGNWRIDLKAPKTMAGVRWEYYRHGFLEERISSIEPLREDIVVEVLVISETPGVIYSYSLPKLNRTSSGSSLNPELAPSYIWNVSYGECSLSCGGGIKSVKVTCLRDGVVPVDDSNCDVTTKPIVSVQECKTRSCPARWRTRQWGACSKSCGRGTRSRQVLCKIPTSTKEILTLDSDCVDVTKPKSIRKCKLSSCPAEWKTDSWSKCSRSCTHGRRRRRVYCSRGGRKIRSSACRHVAKPRRKERCVAKRCRRNYRWRVAGWGPCSTRCGKGFQRRAVKCEHKIPDGVGKSVGSRRCQHLQKPRLHLKQKCRSYLCHPNKSLLNESGTVNLESPAVLNNLSGTFSGVWITGRWKECSVTCGRGHQSREVQCMKRGSPSKTCDLKDRPSSERLCNTHPCNLSASKEQALPCTNNFPWCGLVPQHGQCSHEYFGKQCCKACSQIS